MRQSGLRSPTLLLATPSATSCAKQVPASLNSAPWVKPCASHRDCSAPFHLAPYRGKPPAPAEAPDALEIQKLLAGMADRGADVAVVECASEGLEEGRSALLQVGKVATSSTVPGREVQRPGMVAVLQDCSSARARLWPFCITREADRGCLDIVFATTCCTPRRSAATSALQLGVVAFGMLERAPACWRWAATQAVSKELHETEQAIKAVPCASQAGRGGL